MVDWWIQFIKALWLLLPAYVANGAPPLSRGVRPIDFKKNFIDGKRIFGNGKTIEGTFIGLAGGFLMGAIQTLIYPFLNSYAMKLGFYLPKMSLIIGFLLAFGALLGDMVSSFIKRRFGLPRGANVPLLDQWNFIFGAVALVIWFTEITSFMFLIMLLITPVIHRLANVIAYKIKIKREPW